MPMLPIETLTYGSFQVNESNSVVRIFWQDSNPAREWFMVQWILVERYLRGTL